MRSAVYRSASDVQRQEVHEALAVVTDVEREPDRRAWHRAQAARGPDEDVADELERSAGRAQARGGLAAAAAFLRRAAELTEEPVHRAGRTLDAAQANLQAGGYDMALALLAAAEAGPLDDLGRARVDLLRAEIAFAENRGRTHRCFCSRRRRTSKRSTRACAETRTSTLGRQRCSPATWPPKVADWPTSPARSLTLRVRRILHVRAIFSSTGSR